LSSAASAAKSNVALTRASRLALDLPGIRILRETPAGLFTWLEGDLNELRTKWPAYWAATRDSLRALAQSSGGFAQEVNQPLNGALELIGQVMRR